MKGKAKSAGLFFAGTLVGVAIGATTTYKVTSQPYQNIVADQYVSNAMLDTQNASGLRRGSQNEVSKRIEMNLPNYVLMIHHEFKNHPMAPKALQNIKAFYQKNAIPIPANIQPILAGVAAAGSSRTSR